MAHIISHPFLEQLHRSIEQSRRGIEKRASSATLDHTRNSWVRANEFLEAFPHLQLECGWQLACVFTPWPEERDSHLVLVRFDESALPEMPHLLAQWRPAISFGGPATSFPEGSLPDWVDWKVTPRISHDNSAEALFELSIFARWIDQLLNFGHNVFWPRHSVLDDDDRFKELLEQCGARVDVSELQPSVSVFDARDDAPDHLPTGPEGREAMRGKQRALVQFFTHTAYIEEAIHEHHDWYVDGVFAGRQSFVRGRGSNPYIV